MDGDLLLMSHDEKSTESSSITSLEESIKRTAISPLTNDKKKTQIEQRGLSEADDSASERGR